MMIFFLKKLILKSRTLMLRETRMMQNFLSLLIKLGSTRAKWTIEEIFQLKSHMKHLVFFATAIVIFALPFGLLLLPLYTKLLDRRNNGRIHT